MKTVDDINEFFRSVTSELLKIANFYENCSKTIINGIEEESLKANEKLEGELTDLFSKLKYQKEKVFKTKETCFLKEIESKRDSSLESLKKLRAEYQNEHVN